MSAAPPCLDFDLGPLGPRLDVAARSAAAAHGTGGRENQDNYLLIDAQGNARYLRDGQEEATHLPHWPHGHGRVAVLDGMGGHVQGRQAAEATVAALLTLPPCGSATELAARLDALHAELQHHFDGAHENGFRRPGTTLTLLELRPGASALLYHAGDSRLYELTADQATPLTVDHVPATAVAMAGQLDEHEWWRQVHGEHRSQISQAFILGNAFASHTVLSDPLFPLTPLNLPPWLCHLPDRRAVELRPGRTYLLATDGFWSCPDGWDWVARWPAMLGSAQTAHAKLDILFTEIALRPPAQLHLDNITAVALRVLAPATPPHDDTALPAA